MLPPWNDIFQGWEKGGSISRAGRQAPQRGDQAGQGEAWRRKLIDVYKTTPSLAAAMPKKWYGVH
jgi:hypothetical protein